MDAADCLPRSCPSFLPSKLYFLFRHLLSQQPCDSVEAGFRFEGCPEKPMDTAYVPGNCCWQAVMSMWPSWTNQMKERCFILHWEKVSFSLSAGWPCTGKPVSIPVVAGHHSATKKKANLRTKWIYTEGVRLRGMPKSDRHTRKEARLAEIPFAWILFPRWQFQLPAEWAPFLHGFCDFLPG